MAPMAGARGALLLKAAIRRLILPLQLYISSPVLPRSLSSDWCSQRLCEAPRSLASTKLAEPEAGVSEA